MSQQYRGRFAPSPSGPLHFGSMLTAVASYLEAKSNMGKWLLRIDDLDRPRCIEGMDKHILDTLEYFGMYWDEEVAYQSHNQRLYEETLQILREDKLVYACGCSRREIADIAKTGSEGPIYPGTCRNGLPAGKVERSTRFICPSTFVEAADRIQPIMGQNLQKEIGDFIVKRADGLFAYQLAVVVDDHAQAVTDIVRGSDLLRSTPRQIWLQEVLDYDVPGYAHIPVATQPDGRKLSKQTFAKAVEQTRPMSTLVHALGFLNQQPDPQLLEADLDAFWQWAIENWDLHRVPTVAAIPLSDNNLY
jgi:glutamyl-Q tRNA(Asp) synthetase